MRWPWKRKPQVVTRCSVTSVGEIVTMTIETAYEDVETALTTFTAYMSAETADALHRSLSKAADRARTYPDRVRAQRLQQRMDVVFGAVMDLADRQQKWSKT